MKYNIKKEKGVTMVALVITVLILLILTNMLIYNAQDNIYIKKLTDLYNDISILREKVSAYYNEYGKIPVEIKYEKKYIDTSGLSSVLSTQNDTGDFYVIDLEAMQGITLNYGKDYEKVKNDKENVNNYTDLYIINENSHNIFYVKGIKIKENNTTKTYYTDYTEPDQTAIDLRYIDGILIPDGYYYIGKTTDSSGNESIVISNTQGEQYTWTKQISDLEKIPDSVTLESNQKEYQFIESVNTYKGYFKNSEGKVQYIVIDEESWSEAYTKDTEYKDKKGDKVTIPKGFRVSMSPTMNMVEKGLVVKDSNDNEWVWIVVPESIFITTENDTDYDNIKSDLIEYAKDYREGKSGQGRYWTDEWYAIDGDTLVTESTEGLTDTQKKLSNGCGLTYNEYQTAYQKMLSSVYINGGFWISRYEIGDETATNNNYEVRTANSGTAGKAVSKSNQVPYNYVTCSQAQSLASNMSTDINKTSSLLFGIQWDLVCKFLQEKGNLSIAEIKGGDSVGSTNWGNYNNSSIMLNRGKYNASPDSLDSQWLDVTPGIKNGRMLLTTGASENAKKMNIYDFAGNEWEWTLEHATSNASRPCSNVGGTYYGDGYEYPASVRDNDANTDIYVTLGFRSTIY